MTESLPVDIRYSGKDVQDGSMALTDVVGALQGFSNAYTKIVIYKKVSSQHVIRVKGIRKGSVDFLLEVVEFVEQHADAIQTIGVGASAAVGILGLFLRVIELTKHTKDKPHTAKIAGEGNQNVIVQNCEQVSLSFPIQVYQIYKEGLIKQDLSKISDPLEEGRIDSVTITAKKGKEKLVASIVGNERAYFRYSGEETTKTQEMVLMGAIISLNKERNGGSFRLQDGTRISYKLKSDHPENMYQHFLHRGLVKVKCIAHLDENLKPLSIDISQIEELQMRLL